MIETLSLLVVFLLCLAGNVYLILSQEKHRAAVLEGGISTALKRLSPWIGWGCLLAGLALSISLESLAFGLVTWFFMAALSVILAALTLALRPHWLRRFAF
ncbi:MAG: DUF3325 domain-containing protein [Pseudomonadota bacterium]